MTWLERLKRWLRGEPVPHALVIGAGVAGLTSALFLDTSGIRPSILEQRPERAKGPRSAILNGSTLEGYDSIGLMGIILRASNPYARRICNVGAGPLDPRLKPRVGSRILPHAQLVEILEEELDSRWIPVERGKRVISVNQSPSRAFAVLEGGARADATHIVAADGPGSVAGSAFGAPRAVQRVRGWNISGVSRSSHLPDSLARQIAPDVSLMASKEHLYFAAQMNDPTDENSIAWSLYLRSGENLATSAVTVADKREQIFHSVRALERLAPGVITMVRSSHSIDVRTVAAPGPTPVRGLGRILTSGSASHGGRELLPTAANTQYADSMRIPERIGVAGL